jgi:hypothetical protein
MQKNEGMKESSPSIASEPLYRNGWRIKQVS